MDHFYKTFVSVGNSRQPFIRLLNAIEDNINILPKPILIQHGHTPFTSKSCDTIKFISMDYFHKYISRAELLIFHAGAGSIINALHINKKAIVMPRRSQYQEIINDHQYHFARLLYHQGKIELAENSHELKNAILHIQQFGYTLKMIRNTIPLEAINKLLMRISKTT